MSERRWNKYTPLRKVTSRIRFSRAYLTRTYWYETLECGHADAYTTEYKRATRRHCLACAPLAATTAGKDGER